MSLIIAFHIWPEYLTGGYVGVDVFFVVSGFLITKHLVGEVRQTGTIRLLQFWIKRIRRLLPASLFVLFICALVSYFILPKHELNQILVEIAASTLYIQNWILIENSVNYLSIENKPTLVQHFWTLSVEEQFYIAWPLALLATTALSKYYNRLRFDKPMELQAKTILTLVVGVFSLSLVYSVFESHYWPKQAYFSTFTRAWEFALGAGLVFFSGTTLTEICSKKFRAALSWCGFTMITSSAFWFSDSTTFPGYAALLPTIGTAMVIGSQTDKIPASFGFLSRFPPIKFLGDVSYSAYLWHWPLIIIIPILAGGEITDWGNATLAISLTLITSYFSKIWIEAPFIRKTSAFEFPRVTFISALSGTTTVLLLCLAISTLIPQTNQNPQPLDKPFSSHAEVQAALTHTMSMRRWPPINQQPGEHSQVVEWTKDICNSPDIGNPADLKRCRYGNMTSNKLVVVIGDSWATHLLPAIREVFSSEWRIQVLTLSQCPIADVPVHQWGKKLEFKECVQHRHAVLEWLEAQQPSLIIVSDSPISTASRLMGNDAHPTQSISIGLEKAYTKLGALNLPVLHIESPPRINCFFEKTDGPHQCKPKDSTKSERQLSEAKIAIARAENFRVIDLTYWVCTENLICPNQIGNRLVKADSGHFSNEFSRSIGGILGIEIERLGISF